MRTPMMFAALMSLSLAACATNDLPTDGDALPGPTVSKTICPHGCSRDVQVILDNGEWFPTGQGSFVNSRSSIQGETACNALPQTGACAYACDQLGFVESLPIGTCAAIACKIEGGGDLVVGGCHDH